MRRAAKTVIATAALFALPACGSGVSSDTDGAPGIAGEAAPVRARAARRMAVDQLRNSVPIVMGTQAGPNQNPIRWEFGGQDVLDQGLLGGTLGDPDYEQVTFEGAVPNALYVKFMDDMARNLCATAAQEDQNKNDPSARTLMRFADVENTTDAAIDENIRYLMLRFTGIRLPEGTSPELEGLRRVYDAALADDNVGNQALEPVFGWRAVCVAIVKSPEFHVY